MNREMLMLVAVSILFLIVCINDFLFFRIEDSLSVSLVVLYAIAYISGDINSSILQALSIASLCFAISVVLNHFDLLGGGDVKLLFGIGLFISDSPISFMICLSVFSLIIAAIYITCSKNIELIRQRLSKTVFHLKDTYENQMMKYLYIAIFPSAYKVTEEELSEIKQSDSIIKQEIPYGVILSLSTISSIILFKFNGGIEL